MTGIADRLERLFDDDWNGNAPSTTTHLVRPEYGIHDRDLADELRGPDLSREPAGRPRAIFPAATFTIDDVVAAPPSVAVWWTMRGTHEGPLFGVEPTGRRVELSAIEIDRFDGGLLRETWTQSDQPGRMELVGALPTDGEP